MTVVSPADERTVPNGPQGPLEALQHVRSMLEHASSLTEVKQIRDEAKVLRTYCRTAVMGLKMQNACAELKLRAERKAGELHIKPGPKRDADTLSAIGIAHHQSSRSQRIASIPEAVFDTNIAETVSAGRELTSARMLQLARTIAAQIPPSVRLCTLFRAKTDFLALPGPSTIVADCRWPYDNETTRNAANKHYLCNTTEREFRGGRYVRYALTATGASFSHHHDPQSSTAFQPRSPVRTSSLP